MINCVCFAVTNAETLLPNVVLAVNGELTVTEIASTALVVGIQLGYRGTP
jgi:hypothetical protein